MRDWLSHRVDASPDASAVIDADAGTEWSYAELDATVDDLADSLRTAGIDVGDHLGVLMTARIEFLQLVHAAMRVGAVLVPHNVRLAPPELDRQSDRADLDAIVCEADTEPTAAEIAGETPVYSIDEPERGSVGSLDSDPSRVDSVERSPDDPHLLLFTSGTTGDPKGVVLTAENLRASANASAARLGVSPEDRWLDPLPPYHMGGLAPILRSTLYGTSVVFQTEFDAGATADAIYRHEATGVSLVPTMLARLLDERGGFGDSLRFVLVGGAPTPRELIERCERLDVPICPTYGMTETASQAATARPAEAFAHPDSVGRPLVFTDVTIVDDGTPRAAGETGEIVVDGPTVMKEYYGDPEATDAAFGEYGFHTGDVGHLDESGRLTVLNRRSDRIVTGGENVNPGTVAEALRDHPDVRDAAVVGLDDPEWGQRVAGLVVPESDASLAPADLREHCADRIARYKHPRTVVFADSLPRTVSGTVDREAVRELLDERGRDI